MRLRAISILTVVTTALMSGCNHTPTSSKDVSSARAASSDTVDPVAVEIREHSFLGEYATFRVTAGATPHAISVTRYLAGAEMQRNEHEYSGGFDGFVSASASACAHMEHAVLNSCEQSDPNFRSLTVTVVSGNSVVTSQMFGSIRDMVAEYRKDLGLYEVLAVISRGQPKSYRLINECGPQSDCLPR